MFMHDYQNLIFFILQRGDAALNDELSFICLVNTYNVHWHLKGRLISYKFNASENSSISLT
jgi:hypothetical protein